MTILNIPLKLASEEYISTEHYFQEQISSWIKKQQTRYARTNQELKDLFPVPDIKLNRIIEDRKGNKIIVETKTL